MESMDFTTTSSANIEENVDDLPDGGAIDVPLASNGWRLTFTV